MHRQTHLLALVLILLPTALLRAQLVDMQNIDVTAGVTQGGTSTSQQAQLTNPSFPFLRVHNPATSGVANQTVYSFTSSPSSVVFDFDLLHTRNGLGLSESYGTLYFSTSEPLFYTLNGDWDLMGTTSYFNQQALLETVDRATTYFDGKNTFSNLFQPEASNLQYDLGVLQGNPLFSHLIGARTGFLAAGDYVFEYSYDFENISGPTSLADGLLRLTLTPVPEPRTHVLLVVGTIAALMAVRRKSWLNRRR